jgi:hypothetical protein
MKFAPHILAEVPVAGRSQRRQMFLFAEWVVG